MRKEILLDAKEEVLAKIKEKESENYDEQIEIVVREFREKVTEKYNKEKNEYLIERNIELAILDKLIAKAEQAEELEKAKELEEENENQDNEAITEEIPTPQPQTQEQHRPPFQPNNQFNR